MRFPMIVVLMMVMVVVEAAVEAGPLRRLRQNQFVAAAPTEAAEQTQDASSVQPKKAESKSMPTKSVDDALAEVNAKRAQRGLRPFLSDKQLNEAARACAKIRANKLIECHLDNDFEYLPTGSSATAAGCGALEPSWGWATCCTYDNYTYAGAAWVMGTDGKRYMHMFVR